MQQLSAFAAGHAVEVVVIGLQPAGQGPGAHTHFFGQGFWRAGAVEDVFARAAVIIEIGVGNAGRGGDVVRPGGEFLGHRGIEHEIAESARLACEVRGGVVQFVGEAATAMRHQDRAFPEQGGGGANRGGEELHHERAQPFRGHGFERPSHDPANSPRGRQALHQGWPERRDEAQDRATDDVAVHHRAAMRQADGDALAGGVWVYRGQSAHFRAAEMFLHRRIGAEIAACQDHAPPCPYGLGRLAGRSGRYAGDAAGLLDQPVHDNVGADLHAEGAAVAAEMVGKRARVRQHVVHSRLAVRRLGHRTDEFQSGGHQPVHRLADVVDEEAAQGHVVAIGVAAGQHAHILEMRVRRILDAGALLVRGSGGGDGADRPGGAAAELAVLFQEQDLQSQPGGLTGCCQAGTAAADHDNVDVRVGEHRGGIRPSVRNATEVCAAASRKVKAFRQPVRV